MSAASSSNGGGKPSGKPAVHADDRARGNTLWGSKPSGKPCDSPCDTLSDSPSGKPCAGTRTGSNRPPLSPDRLPLHLTTIPARVQAETLVAVPPGQKPLQRMNKP